MISAFKICCLSRFGTKPPAPAAEPFLEQMAEKAKQEREAHFGNSVQLFTPLYISNYCENQCVYCGFNCKNAIHRSRLSAEEIEKEMQAIAKTDMREVLLLTGESRTASDVQYIGEAVQIAKNTSRRLVWKSIR